MRFTDFILTPSNLDWLCFHNENLINKVNNIFAIYHIYIFFLLNLCLVFKVIRGYYYQFSYQGKFITKNSFISSAMIDLKIIYKQRNYINAISQYFLMQSYLQIASLEDLWRKKNSQYCRSLSFNFNFTYFLYWLVKLLLWFLSAIL